MVEHISLHVFWVYLQYMRLLDHTASVFVVFKRNLRDGLHDGCTIIHCQQQHVRAFTFPPVFTSNCSSVSFGQWHSNQREVLVTSSCFYFAFVDDYWPWALFSIYLLTICSSFLKNHLFISFAHYLLDFCCSIPVILSYWCSLDINSSLGKWLANIFFQAVKWSLHSIGLLGCVGTSEFDVILLV